MDGTEYFATGVQVSQQAYGILEGHRWLRNSVAGGGKVWGLGGQLQHLRHWLTVALVKVSLPYMIG